MTRKDAATYTDIARHYSLFSAPLAYLLGLNGEASGYQSGISPVGDCVAGDGRREYTWTTRDKLTACALQAGPKTRHD